ncbi:SDR family NAD(P)-dependent oxidoreductase [Chania multitudinisentens]|uniref:SDR family NAD(P)-dependent oxidoreductase n=1 Tax=Chania multitudinisentens TaxID=1639108 RepID=UPI0003E138FA|nr:SDR family NAD(P)-dependent oxidoreductase [Chania multitudinisentens]
MDIKNLKLDELLTIKSDGMQAVKVSRPNGLNGSIAVIGMAGKLSSADNLDEFWQQLCQGQTSVRQIPALRQRDVEEYLRLQGALGSVQPQDYLHEAYLTEVDKFDYRFFGLAKQEANLMDPEQRLFLETAWAAFEDAGHCGPALRGSKTGVYVGFSKDFGEDYRRIVGTLAPDAPEIAIVGNIKSVIAGRLSYLLDLKGPSLLVDTACSSSLVALHLACRALQRGECEMAVAGTVKTHLVPLLEDPSSGVGMKDIQDTFAADNRTKTFDSRSDGMSVGEGVLAFILKPLERALADGDHVHAVLRGSAVNQDGQSVGLTAPNSAAQAEVIRAALADANVQAQEVSYIEAHGTGTRLGDPIEVSGIRQAFSFDTDRKQFCAIGSVKTNIGHLDNAAGLAGLAKVILSLRHGMLPASLHFNQPNSKIPFEHSPVFVNDRLRSWGSDGNKPLIAGISSFGLSGTNCHLIVQAAGKRPEVSTPAGPYLLPLSAKSEAVLAELARSYLHRLDAADSLNLADLSFTATTGRQHHSHRLAIVFADCKALRAELSAYLSGTASGYQHGHFHLITDEAGQQSDTGLEALTESQQRILSAEVDSLAMALNDPARRESVLQQAAQRYCAGAQFNWNDWFPAGNYRRIPLPTYPFARERCWVATTAAGEALANRRHQPQPHSLSHPLVTQQLVNGYGLQVYRSELSARHHWELAEHKVRGVCILPGTCYLDMMLFAARQLSDSPLVWSHFDKIQFLSPLALSGNETRTLHIQAQSTGRGCKIQICSCHESGEWLLHAEGELTQKPQDSADPAIQLDKLKTALPVAVALTQQDELARGLEVGGHWAKTFQQGWANQAGTEYLIHLSLPGAYATELERYFYHPALMDNAINAANHLVGNGELYLPLAYEDFTVYQPLPADCYARIRLNGPREGEVIQFAIELLDTQGQLCCRVRNYSIKRVVESLRAPTAFTLGLAPLESVPEEKPAAGATEPVLLIHAGTAESTGLATFLQQRGIEVQQRLLDQGLDHGQQSYSAIIYAANWHQTEPEQNRAEFQRLTAMLKTLVHNKVANAGPLLFLTQQAFEVNGAILPIQSALASFVRVFSLENPQLRLRCLDIQPGDGEGLWQALWPSVSASESTLSICHANQRYNEVLQPVELPEAKSLILREGGVYLITGGTGALGLQLAQEIARQAQAQQSSLTLALTGRHPLPPAEQWAELLASGKLERKLAIKLTALQAIQDCGVTIVSFAVDAANRSAMQNMMQRLRVEYGSLAGVVHAAGRAGDGFLIHKTPEQLDEVLSAKVQGAWNLHQLTSSDSLDFFIMYSSIASLIHEAGQSDYTAANRFLNALAVRRRRQGLVATALCWPAWRELGIAFEYGAIREDELFSPVSPLEGGELLMRVLTGGQTLPPVLVLAQINPAASLEDLTALELQANEALAARLSRTGGGDKPIARSHAAVTLTGLDNPDEFDLMVASVWGEVLGLNEVNIDENFNDLGGNSILTTQKYKTFGRLAPGVIDMADLFIHTTIRAQARFFRQANGPDTALPAVQEKANAAMSDMDDILARLARGELSAEEAQTFL